MTETRSHTWFLLMDGVLLFFRKTKAKTDAIGSSTAAIILLPNPFGKKIEKRSRASDVNEIM